MAERWNGTKWSIQHAPNPDNYSLLDDIFCTSKSACTAVGKDRTDTLTERWDGTKWSTQDAPLSQGAPWSASWTVSPAPLRVPAPPSGSTPPWPRGRPLGTVAERWTGG